MKRLGIPATLSRCTRMLGTVYRTSTLYTETLSLETSGIENAMRYGMKIETYKAFEVYEYIPGVFELYSLERGMFIAGKYSSLDKAKRMIDRVLCKG